MSEPSGDAGASERPEAAGETDRFGFLLANGCTAGSGPPPELVRQREAKWINIISQWDHVLQKKNSKVKEQCQKGIPASLRARCWPLLCGAKRHMEDNRSLYQSLDSRPALQSWVDIIERDLDRQFPFHEMFVSKDGHGQRGLFRVLKAYTQYQPDEGYCQAQGPVAAVLLMNMPAEEAFWCLVQISEQYLPGYYSQLLEGVLFDAAMLSWVLKRACPAAHRHLQRYGVEPLMFATDWLMCLFTRHLPFNTLLRVWDLFFCYASWAGVRVLFQVAVVLVRRVLGRAEQRQECPGQMETLERLRAVRASPGLEDDASFMAEVCSVPLSRSDLKRRTEKQLETWRRDRPSSTFDPRGRCHGYWTSRETSGDERDQKGDLSVPLVRSASALSLSPSLFHKRWGRRSEPARVERHHSMGVHGVGREGWQNIRALRGTSVQEEEDGRQTPGRSQSCSDTEPQAGGRRPLQKESEPGENHDSQGNALKGEPEEQEGTGHRTREDQEEQSPGLSGPVQEGFQPQPDLREGAAGGGATHRSAVQPTTLEQDLKDNDQSGAPEEHEDNNQSEGQEAQELRDNNQSEVQEEQDLKDNDQSQVQEAQELRDNNQSEVQEAQELRDNNQSEVQEEQELRDNNQSQVQEAQELRDNNQSEVQEAQELRDNNQSEVQEEQELRDNNQSQVQEAQELRDNNQSEVQEAQELRDNNQSEVQEEQELRDNNQSEVQEEQELRDNNQSEVQEEQELRDNNQSEVQEDQELRDNNQSEVQDEQKCNSKQNQKEEVAQKNHRVKTLHEMAQQAAHSRHLVARQEPMRETTGTSTDTEPPAAVDAAEQQTPELETTTHTDTGTPSECESVEHESTTEFTAQQGPAPTVQEVITDAEEAPTETEAPTTDLSGTQKPPDVGTDYEDHVDAGKTVVFKSEASKENTVPFQEVGVFRHQGVQPSGESRGVGDFVVSTMTARQEPTVVPETSADTQGSASCSERAGAQEEAPCSGSKREESTALDTNAETEEDRNDTTTRNQTTSTEVKFSPWSATGDRTCDPPTGAAEPLPAEAAAAQVSVGEMEERIENDKAPVDSAEVSLTPAPSPQRPSAGARPQIQDTPLPVGAEPEVGPCVPAGAHAAGPPSSQTPTPSGDGRVRKASSSRGSRLARRRSEDIFTAPETTRVRPHPDGEPPSRPGLGSPPPGALSALPPPQGPPGGPAGTTEVPRGGAPEEPPRRPGFFSRLRGSRPKDAERTAAQKVQIPKIFLQDFSSGPGEQRPLEMAEEQQEPLSSRARRRRRREREQKEREEEKERRRVEKELKKERRKRARDAGSRRGPAGPSEPPQSCSSPHSASYF